ncbi:MAG: type IV pilus assembly protein PilM [Patescibacteria group bacterium]|nr:type IV pilus assembly protein PilM [Patescibacteria group bacterium]
MLEFLTLKPEAFGLDISDLSLKIIKLKKRGKLLGLASFGESEIKPGIIKEGEIKNEEKLAEIIKEAIKKVKGEKLKTKYVVASLPEEKAFLQVIQMPKMTEEDLKSALIYEIENYIPLPIEEIYLDFQIVPPVYNHLDHCDVLLAALPKKTVDPYLSSFKKAGLQPKAFEIESLSVSRALIKDEVSTFPVLLIDLGATRTSFIVFSGCSLRFTSSIPVSSGGFTEIISKNLKVSLAEAERLKIKYGLEEKVKLKIKDINMEIEREERKIFEALIPALVDLIQQIKKHLAYYQTHACHEHLPPNGKEISKILLCGGGANLKGLTELLTLKLKIPVELANPWVNILPEDQREIPELPFEKSLSYTTALGLALRGIKL